MCASSKRTTSTSSNANTVLHLHRNKIDHIGRLTWQLIEQHDAELLEVEGKIKDGYI